MSAIQNLQGLIREHSQFMQIFRVPQCRLDVIMHHLHTHIICHKNPINPLIISIF